MALNTNNYTADYPALDPLASGLEDSPAGPIFEGSPLNSEDILAAEIQLKMRLNLYEANYVTHEELAAAKKRKLQIEMEHATAGAIGPAWANGLQVAVQNLTRDVCNLTRDVGNLTRNVGNLTRDVGNLTQTVGNLTQAVGNLTQTINHPESGLEAISNRLKQQEARNMNQSSIRTNSDIITAIPCPGRGEDRPRWMPRTCNDIIECTARDANTYLNFYNLENNRSLAEKRQEILKHLGITI
jgi:hypothetical protein